MNTYEYYKRRKTHDLYEDLMSYSENRAGEIADLTRAAAERINELRGELRFRPSLWIRDRYTNTVHRIGDDQHDSLFVDEFGTVHYFNMQCGDGCIGYKSLERKTLSEEAPWIEWGERKGELVYGFEFVPNLDDDGEPCDPTEAGDGK